MPRLHRATALRRLRDGQPHQLRFWKCATGEIIDMRGAVCLAHSARKGTTRFRLKASGQIRLLRDITIFEVDGCELFF